MFYGLLFTLLTGIFFLIGILIFKNIKNKEKTASFTTALAFIVLFGLLIFDLLKELIEINNYLLIIPCVLGFLILVFLDKLIPHHHHEHHDDCNHTDHELHLNHIGVVTIISLGIHNMIEGLTLYNVTLTSIKSGLLMMLGISLHNIPLGFQIGNSINLKKNNKLLIFLLCISSLLGGLIYIIFGGFSESIESVLLSLTFGMLLYILVFELLGEIINHFRKKETILGLLLGIILLVIANII